MPIGGGKKTKLGKTRLDVFYRMAKEQGYRSRAAFKLIQLNKKYEFLNSATALVDLGCAPGGWLQVAAKYMPVSSTIIGVDLDVTASVKGCITMQMDLTTAECRAAIRKHLNQKKVDVVLHDGSPNVGGAWAKEAFSQSELVLASVKTAVDVLAKGGWFVSKIFRSRDYNALLWVFNQLFRHVHVTKPAASRNTSAEIYVVCSGYLAPKSVDPRLLDARFVFGETAEKKVMSVNDLVDDGKKKKRQRGGYADGKSVLYEEGTVGGFVRSDDPLQYLAQYNALKFAEPGTQLIGTGDGGESDLDDDDSDLDSDLDSSDDDKNDADNDGGENKTKKKKKNSGRVAAADMAELMKLSRKKGGRGAAADARKALQANRRLDENKLLRRIDDSFYREHRHTTEDIVLFFEDLRVLGKRDIKELLHWRVRVRKAAVKEAEQMRKKDIEAAKLARAEARAQGGADDSDDSDAEGKGKGSDDSDDSDGGEADERLQKQLDAIARREKRKRRKERKRHNERQRRINMGMEIPGDVIEQQEDDGVFSLQKLGLTTRELRKQLRAASAEEQAAMLQRAHIKQARRDQFRMEDLDAAVDDDELKEFGQLFGAGDIDDEELGDGSDDSDSGAGGGAGGRSAVIDDGELMGGDANTDMSLQAQRWFNQAIFADDDGAADLLDDDDDEDMQDEKTQRILKEARKSRRALLSGSRAGDDDDDDDDDSDSSNSDHDHDDDDEDDEGPKRKRRRKGSGDGSGDGDDGDDAMDTTGDQKDDLSRFDGDENESDIEDETLKAELIRHLRAERHREKHPPRSDAPRTHRDYVSEIEEQERERKEREELDFSDEDADEGGDAMLHANNGADSDFQVVPRDESTGGGSSYAYNSDSEPDSDYDSDELAELLALGKHMLTKQNIGKLFDDSFNRYTFEEKDKDLPEWFRDDEKQHSVPQLPVTKEEIEEEKLRLKLLDAAPIKKVAEAQARKKLRTVRKLQRVRKQAAAIANEQSLGAGEKSRQLEKLYRGTKDVKPERIYVVSRKSGGGKTANLPKMSGNVKVKVVDAKMKSDTRGRVRAESRQKRGIKVGGRGGGSSRKRQRHRR